MQKNKSFPWRFQKRFKVHSFGGVLKKCHLIALYCVKLTNKWSKFNIYLFVGVWSFSSRRKSRLGCLYHRQQGSYLRVEVSSSYNFLPHFSLSPLRVASLAWRWFSRALAFRSFYYPWGKMGTTRSLKQLRLWGPQKVRDTGPSEQKKPGFQGLRVGLSYFLRHLHFRYILVLY